MLLRIFGHCSRLSITFLQFGCIEIVDFKKLMVWGEQMLRSLRFVLCVPIRFFGRHFVRAALVSLGKTAKVWSISILDVALLRFSPTSGGCGDLIRY